MEKSIFEYTVRELLDMKHNDIAYLWEKLKSERNTLDSIITKDFGRKDIEKFKKDKKELDQCINILTYM